MNDLIYTMEQVVPLLNLQVRRAIPGQLYVDCPFCTSHSGQARKGKLNINLSKNVFRCNRCGEAGGVLRLYMLLHNMDYKTACTHLEKCVKVPDYKKKKQLVLPSVENSLLASIETLHQTYTALLSCLTLSNTHRLELKRRGLSDQLIDMYGYKSVPLFGNIKLTEKLMKQGCTVEGVPGFYMDSDKWTLVFKKWMAGFLIPAVSPDGMINGLQIRLDQPLDNAKYITLSSSKFYKGTSPGGLLHFRGNLDSKAIYLTEALLKVDIAHALGNITIAGVGGSGNYNSFHKFFAYLKQLKNSPLIIEAYDMDKYTNNNVLASADKAVNIGKEYGFNVKRMKWLPDYNGIDDWFLNRVKKENG